MSLKAFHLVFITASELLTLGFGGWCLTQYSHGGTMQDLIFGIGSFTASAGLLWYGKYFLKKLKNISYL